jgi:hypothetical protein
MILICRRYVTINGRKRFPPPGQNAICFYVTEEKHRAYLEKQKKSKKADKDD